MMIFPRKITERLSKGITLRRKILVKGKPYPVIVSPDAQVKYIKPGFGAFDQDLISIAEDYLSEDSNVWDVGANVGIFTFAAAAVAQRGTIVSVEPDIWLANLIRKTSRFREYSQRNIHVIPAAIADKNALAAFQIAKRSRASNALESVGGRSQMGGVREIQYVPTLTLDSLLKKFPAPDFVKVDVEGAELLVLQGAEKLIHGIRPIFYIEVGKKVSDQVALVFQSADYSAYDPDGNELIGECATNTTFIPKENQTA